MAASIFDERLAEIIEAANRQRGMEPNADLIRVMNALADLPKHEREGAGPAVANALPALTSPTGAGFLAVWLGAGVENGADPQLTVRPIIDTFLKWSRTVETAPEPGEGEDVLDTPEPAPETIDGLQFLGRALVAHVARAPEARKWMKENAEVRREFERVEHLSYGAAWVVQLLRQCSGRLVVLNTAEKIGAVVRYNNISNCFHLFTLLQGALADVMPDARRADKSLLEIARGGQQGQWHDTAWWHYGQPEISSPELAAMVWGEMEPSGIASIDGTQVLLLWPPVLQSRGWDGGFFAPVLEASLPDVEVLEVLPQAAVIAWWARLNLPEPQRPAWQTLWKKFMRWGGRRPQS
jgi:hypothetical protein